MGSVRNSFKALGRDAGAYGIASVLGRSSAFLLLPVYTRVFSPAEFGILEAAVIASAFLNLIMQAELNNSLMRYFGTASFEGRRDLVTTLFVAVGAFGGLLSVLGTLGAWAGRQHWGAGVPILVALVLWTAFATALSGLASAHLRMERRVGRAVSVNLIAALGALPLILGFVLLLDWGVPGVLAGTLLATSAGAAFGIGSIRSSLTGVFRFDVLRRCVTFAVPYVPTVASRYLRRFSDRLLLLALIGPAAMGVYAFGAKLAGLLEVVIQAFRTAWVPISLGIIGEDHQIPVYERALRYYVLLMGTAAIAVVAAAPVLLELLGSSAYEGALPLIGWLVGAAVVAGASGYVVVGAMVAERSSVAFHGTLVGTLVGVAAIAGGIALFGIRGAAIGTFIGSLSATATTYWLSQRAFPVPYAGRAIAGVVGLYVVLLLTLIPWSDQLPSVFSILVRICTVLVFVIGCVLLLLPAHERATMRRDLPLVVANMLGRRRAPARPGNRVP